MSIKSIPEKIWSVLLVGWCLLVGYPICVGSIADWLQPSFVGLVWGGQFVLGIWLGGSNQHSFWRLLISCTSFLWCAVGFQRVTDFSFREALLFCVLISSAGFVIIRSDQRAARMQWKEHRTRKPLQISLIDLFVATTVTAVLASGLRNLTAPPALLIGVGLSLMVGCCCCWMTYHWAWNDHQPVGWPLLLALISILFGYCWLRFIAPSLGLRELCHWLICGPASVLAAQCFTVLAALGLVRGFVPACPDSLSRECNLS